MTEAHATVGRKRGINPIWFVPIVALALGIWMVVYTIQQEGPEVTITFSTAEGIEEGKTKIKLREVEIGLVEEVRLGEGEQNVVVTASLEKEAAHLLRPDTQFWVVRPRIGKSGVSGLGTLLSGGYIQITPGTAEGEQYEFVGLEEPPVTPAGTPGVRIKLTADRAGSVSAGDPVLFKGYTVGQVETEDFDVENQRLEYQVFINAPFDKKLTRAHRFWDVSGITAKAGADGIEVDSVALETLLIGGVEIGLPEGIKLGAPAQDGDVFRLFESYAAVNERPYNARTQFVVRFAQSVRGLRPGAPVEYRGIRIGEVERVMVAELTSEQRGTGAPIPILISVQPARMELSDDDEGVARMREAVERSVKGGLRAALSTGNLLTGALYVSLDIYPDAEAAEIGDFDGYATIPTVATGLEGVLVQLTNLLTKFNELPLETTVNEVNAVLSSADRFVSGAETVPASLEATLNELEATLASYAADSELQNRLLPTITELERTLASLRLLLDTLDRQPNALIFDREHPDDPVPPSGANR